MKNWSKNLMITIASIVVVVILGCAAMQNAVTPCLIEPASAEYADVNSTSFMPYTTLLDAYRIDDKMGFVHQKTQINYTRLAEDDSLMYNFLKDAHAVNIQKAQEFQRLVFEPEGVVGLLLPTLAGGTLGALLIKRPGDKSKKDAA